MHANGRGTDRQRETERLRDNETDKQRCLLSTLPG